jgi:hypothetical protein
MKIIRDKVPAASGPVFSADGRVNAVYAGELFDAIARETTSRLKRRYRVDVPLSGGLWGGSWYFADEQGYTRARFRRLYSLVCVPQIPALNDVDNYEQVFQQYSKVIAEAFDPFGIALRMPQYGESIPYSNRLRPTLSFQIWDWNQKIEYVRSFFVYNSASWEEAYLYDTVRLIKQAKEALDSKATGEPPRLEGMPARNQLQDIVILYSTLEPAMSEEAKAAAAPIVGRIKTRFSQGINDENEMNAINAEAFRMGMIYMFEDAIREDFEKEGLDITKIEEWPISRINRVPEGIKAKLLPALQGVFQGFREHLKAAEAMTPGAKGRQKSQ